jgi:glutathione-specific gamma-glutamylcyclotransferase
VSGVDCDGGEDLWVFGYGSLMWRPGFDFAERTLATVRGLHRALCVWSHVHRGTPDRPGLVLGLDKGGSCRGVAFRVAAERREATIAYLREREQVTSVYVEILVEARLADGRRVKALAYRADRRHPQYSGHLAHEELLRVVQDGVGLSGANPDYVLATQDHLVELGIHDATLSRLAAALRASEAATISAD